MGKARHVPGSGLGPVLVLLCVACSSPVASLENLEDIHRDDPTPKVSGAVERMQMVRLIEDRGRCHRLWNSLRGLVFLDPVQDDRRISDPIKFSLYQLEVVEEKRDQVQGWSRWQAMLLLAELSRRSPSRAVREQCFRVLSIYAEEQGLMPGDWAVEDEPSEEESEALSADVAALGKLVPIEDEVLDRVLAAESEALCAAARRLARARIPDVGTTERLSRIAILVGRRVPGEALAAELEEVARRQTAHTLFHSAVVGCTLVVPNVQQEAVRLALRLDPAGASRKLAPLMPRNLASPAVQVALLQTLAESPPDPEQLAAGFRRRLVLGLDMVEASWLHWTREALARMLDLPPDTESPVLAARWNALGGVEGPGESRP